MQQLSHKLSTPIALNLLPRPIMRRNQAEPNTIKKNRQKASRNLEIGSDHVTQPWLAGRPTSSAAYSGKLTLVVIVPKKEKAGDGQITKSWPRKLWHDHQRLTRNWSILRGSIVARKEVQRSSDLGAVDSNPRRRIKITVTASDGSTCRY